MGWGAAKGSRRGRDNRRTKDEGGGLNKAILDYVDAEQLNVARPLRKCARNVFVVDDDIAHDDAPNELGVNIGFVHARSGTSANLSITGSEKLVRVFILLCVRRVGGKPSIYILGVIGIKLALYYDFWGGICRHDVFSDD
jgi:hypothetical protein